jgi:hypothetical protein
MCVCIGNRIHRKDNALKKKKITKKKKLFFGEKENLFECNAQLDAILVCCSVLSLSLHIY